MDRYPKQFIKEIQKINGLEYFFNKDLSLYSTMRLKSTGNLFVVKNVAALTNLLKYMNNYRLEYITLGLGANMLLPEYSDISYIQLKFPFDKSYLVDVKDSYIFPASVTLSILSSHAVKNNLSGWQCFTGIPATLGGAVFMNAGTNLGEIGPLIEKIQIVTKEGNIKNLVTNQSSFSYRKNHLLNKGDIITEVQIKHNGIKEEISGIIKSYLNLRNKSQPLKAFTCGCVFKNSGTCLAGKMIDQLGLKGLQVGKIRVSLKHANFMENLGGGTKADVLKLILIIQKEIKLNFNIDIQTEAIY